jgi:hypothetical protein
MGYFKKYPKHKERRWIYIIFAQKVYYKCIKDLSIKNNQKSAKISKTYCLTLFLSRKELN